ncbi:dihydrofolate reductase family protein [Mycolicibacterium brumae]|uniref:Dihydrofolate reductase n=1 Tax=Mycolicibacterium brumae TaxID=85968 RepID=A0A2G5PEQ6_9MYCO|nr:dihydrofolate reductase family protein [Mycolicibacterium brumae]MCV7192650.1 dihydrofolate reductase [Mycolicibacterium brumae]PIB76600.1 dihydrofolate reductase [Mycolicibacterium brumae]RWA23234.1 hypothetical protein MBRU_00010 [Mycolicibacterium brumae DSM 44177]UWW08835.1 dihydrofolate reductase family protein [Mycolicibacterium brumae]
MTTTYFTATTLDGFLADPSDSLDWLLRQDFDEDGPFNVPVFLTGIGATVMGSTTYEWIVRRLRETGEDWPYEMPSWVMTSRELERVPGADLHFSKGNIRNAHAEMTAAAGGKDLWVIGGGDLAGQFADAGLLDEVVVSYAPVVLGAGRPLLPRRLDLELIDSARNGAFICGRYRVAGALTEDQ